MDVYSVTQVARYLRESVETDEFLADLWISGELSNVSRSAAGHVYFTLKDANGQLRSVMFRTAANGGAEAVEGAAVVAHGRVAFYEARGDLQFIADVMLPQGVGLLHMEYQRLKAKLEAEGLFETGRKRSLPQFPRRIAVVTSPGGAVLHDITNIIGRRYPLVELLLAPVLVQGDQAAGTIVSALRRLNRLQDIDVILLARGGGSLEELWPFNEERTARAIYASRAPVVSAVGHETDYTIADYVADLRAPTPSAAAELAVPDRRDLAARVSGLGLYAHDLLERRITSSRGELDYVRRRMERGRPSVERERQRLDDLARMAGLQVRSRITAGRAALDRQLSSLAALDPKRTLERGYAIVRQAPEGSVVLRYGQVHSGDPLTIQVSDGNIDAMAGKAGPRRPRRPKETPQEQLALMP